MDIERAKVIVWIFFAIHAFGCLIVLILSGIEREPKRAKEINWNSRKRI